MNPSKNLQTVLEVLKNEVDGDVQAALSKLTEDYSMTWVYRKQSSELFPTTTKAMENELEDVYHIKNREYDIRNVAENDNLVILELIESYPDPESKQIYRTPMILVLEMEDGKIKKGRHYCDPNLSYTKLSKDVIHTQALKGTESKMIIN